MAVKYLTKTKPETKQKKGSVITDPVVAAVERMGELRPKIDEFKPIEAEYEKLRKQLLEQIPSDASEMAPVAFAGTHHAVEFSACGKKRVIADLKKLHKKLGDAVFYAIATIPLKELDKYVSSVEQAQLVVETQTGTRTCTVCELPDKAA